MFLAEATEEDISHRDHREHRGREVRGERKRWFYFFSSGTEKIKPTFLSVNSVSSVRKNPAFTLIELLIVMVVIAILVGITIPISKYVTRQSRLANQRIYVEKIKSALEDYRAAYGEYPITPVTNAAGEIINYQDAMRHYPATFNNTVFGTNYPVTEVHLASNTVESMTSEGSVAARVDYCLTYPLMLKQREQGARPFMEFPDATVLYLMVDDTIEDHHLKHVRWRKTAGGQPIPMTIWGLAGDPVNRPKAIDPVSRKQWKYTSGNGVVYNLTNHTESGF